MREPVINSNGRLQRPTLDKEIVAKARTWYENFVGSKGSGNFDDYELVDLYNSLH